MSSLKLQMTKRPARRVGEVGLFPSEQYSDERLHNDYREGEELKVAITKSRRIGKMNLYWAGLAVLLENLDEPQRKMWSTTRKLHSMLMLELGYYDRLWRIDGTFRIVPDSIAIDNMTDAEFEDAFERIHQFVIDKMDYDPWEEWKKQHPTIWSGRNYRPGIDGPKEDE